MTISFDPSLVELPIGHWINGEYVKGHEELELRRPSDASPYTASPIAGPEVVDRAVTAAKTALKSSGWGSWRPRERASALHRLANLMEANSQRLGQLESLASTRPIGQSISMDVAVTAEQIRFFAEFADKDRKSVV